MFKRWQMRFTISSFPASTSGSNTWILVAVRVSNETHSQDFLEALKRKYDWEPDRRDRDEAWLFRLDPR